MASIIEFLDKNSDNNVRFHKTRKFFIDESKDDVIAENSDQDNVPNDTRGIIAESNTRRIPVVDLPQKLLTSNTTYFTHFLDGSRRVFKVDDVEIGNKILPIMAGQIVVGCCYRKDRDSFKKKKLKIFNVISVPKQLNTKGKPEDFSRDYCSKLNLYLTKNNKFVNERKIKIDNLVFYKTDGSSIKDPFDKNKYRNSAIAQIQNQMVDLEQYMVDELCQDGALDDNNWLIKDGSIQYNPSYSNIDKIAWNNMRRNYKHVLGVSKSFDPDLLKDFEHKNLSQTIADLKPFQRTKAYKYKSNQSDNYFAIWYLRLRKDNNFRETRFSDVVKCELLMMDPSEPISTDLINALSSSLVREAYPVCYGKDSRWANHLYPVYLTETFCKSHYLSSEVFLKLF